MKMKTVILVTSFLIAAQASVLNAESMKGKWIKPDTPAQATYDRMVELLDGDWKMSPDEKQIDTGGAHKAKLIAGLRGTDKTAVDYVVIGKGTTLQENLFTGTLKEMVTMYHCDRRSSCTTLLATHYCAKRNQVRFILNSEETNPNRIVFDCDKTTSLCQSNEDHIHRIMIEPSENDKHLKLSYLGMRDQKWRKKNTITHFDKK